MQLHVAATPAVPQAPPDQVAGLAEEADGEVPGEQVSGGTAR
jgi:hypothetical protein